MSSYRKLSFPTAILLLLLVRTSIAQSAQMDSLIWVNYEYRLETNQDFADSTKSPLTDEDRAEFQSLNWFPIDTNYMVWAHLERTPQADTFVMATTREHDPRYRQYGLLHFELKGRAFKVPVYQNIKLAQKAGFEDYLFFPFTDLSNGASTYGGGRFLDFKIPTAGQLLIDFNRAYNPLCAYNARYSCPIPPRENHLEIVIEAGVRYRSRHH